MSGMLSKLSKVKGRSFDELQQRALQAIAAAADRQGWSERAQVPSDRRFMKMLKLKATDRRYPEISGLREYFRDRRTPHFFDGVENLRAARTELQHRWHRSGSQLIARAERVCEARFDLLGFSDLWFGEPVDWHFEPIAGRQSPRMHWSKIDYLNPEVAGDKKIIWELNRHQHFLMLGRAYCLTLDERYAECFVRHISHWMDENPPGIGINWASSLEVALRSISWIWALYYFRDSVTVTAEVFKRVLKFLYLHGRHIEAFLSTYFSPNTHLSGEALGLFYLGTLLPEMEPAFRWRVLGSRILLECLDLHVLADGVYFERATYYHRYTAEFYLHFYLLGTLNGERFPSKLTEKLRNVLDHLMSLTRPDGTTPYFGDDDGGRLVKLDDRAPNDFRSVLCTGAALFGRQDYKFVAGEASEETFWLLGDVGLQRYDSLGSSAPTVVSSAFPVGGYYIMRDSWSERGSYAVIDCGPHGSMNCGHAHSDALSLDLALKGRSFLVDPGTYTYTGSAPDREWFRSSAAHNTLTVDGGSSSRPGGPFTWVSTCDSELRGWLSEPRFDYFSGKHRGFGTPSENIDHERSVLFLKDDYFILRDHVSAARRHLYELHFHFPPECELHRGADGASLRAGSIAEDLNCCVWTYDRRGEGRWDCELGWVSPVYGARQRSPVARYSLCSTGNTELITFIIPCESSGALGCEVFRAKGGIAYELSRGDYLDVLIVTGGEGGTLSHKRLTAVAEWVWSRYCRSSGEILEFVVINGTNVTLDGRCLFSADSRRSVAVRPSPPVASVPSAAAGGIVHSHKPKLRK